MTDTSEAAVSLVVLTPWLVGPPTPARVEVKRESMTACIVEQRAGEKLRGVWRIGDCNNGGGTHLSDGRDGGRPKRDNEGSDAWPGTLEGTALNCGLPWSRLL